MSFKVGFNFQEDHVGATYPTKLTPGKSYVTQKDGMYLGLGVAKTLPKLCLNPCPRPGCTRFLPR